MRRFGLVLALLTVTSSVQAFEPSVKLVCSLDKGFVLNLFMDVEAEELRSRAEGGQTVFEGRVYTTDDTYSIWLKNNVTLEIDRNTGSTDARTSDGTPLTGWCRKAGKL